MSSGFSESVFECCHAIQKCKYEDENRGCETEQEEEFVTVERNETKSFVLKNRTLCVTRTSDMSEPLHGHSCNSLSY
jgi:hypothetical protein